MCGAPFSNSPSRLSGTAFDPEAVWKNAGPRGVISLLGAELREAGDEETVLTLNEHQNIRIDTGLEYSRRVLTEDFEETVERLRDDRHFKEETVASLRCSVSQDVARHLCEPGYDVLTAVVTRVEYASATLNRFLKEYVHLEMTTGISLWCCALCDSPHELSMRGCVRCPIHRTALLLRLYLIAHMDLLSYLTFAEDKSDLHMRTRLHPNWPSPLEECYPHGTRCKWAATMPAILDVFDRMHWFVKKPQHKSPLLHWLQKVCPHKYMQRNWSNILKTACASNEAMRDVVAEFILCSYVGGYSHALHFPDLKKVTEIWHAMKYSRTAAVNAFLKDNPAFVLFSWKEGLVTQMEWRPDMLDQICDQYEWENFAVMTVSSLNIIRNGLAENRPALMQGIVALHNCMQQQTSKRVLRVPFKSLACKHLDSVLRDKLRAGGIEATGERYVLEGIPGEGNVLRPSPAPVSVFEVEKRAWRGSLVSLPPHADFATVLALSGLPSDFELRLLEVQRAYEARELPDTAAKRAIDAVIKELSDDEFLSLHRKLTLACSPNMPVLMPLSRDAALAHVRVLKPEDRPLYVCTSCGRVGATVVIRKTIGSGGKRRTVAKVLRGLKNVGYSFHQDDVRCGRKSKKPTTARKRAPPPPSSSSSSRLAKRSRKTDGTMTTDAPRQPHNPLVPKHLLDRIRQCTCGTKPMICLDKRGVLIRINARVLAACCGCGMMTELCKQICISSEPLCPTCSRHAAENGLSNATSSTPSSPAPLLSPSEAPSSSRPGTNKRQKCEVCGKKKLERFLRKVLAFQDACSDLPDYYRIVAISVCDNHRVTKTVSSLAQLRIDCGRMPSKKKKDSSGATTCPASPLLVSSSGDPATFGRSSTGRNYVSPAVLMERKLAKALTAMRRRGKEAKKHKIETRRIARSVCAGLA